MRDGEVDGRVCGGEGSQDQRGDALKFEGRGIGGGEGGVECVCAGEGGHGVVEKRVWAVRRCFLAVVRLWTCWNSFDEMVRQLGQVNGGDVCLD